MTANKLNRREALLLTAGALTAGAGLTALPACKPQVDFSPRSAGDEHAERMRQAGKALKGRSPLSQDGLLLLVDDLEQREIISKDDAAVLRQLIKLIFTIPEIPAMLEAVSQLLSSLKHDISDIAVAIVDIARGSIQYVRDTLDRVPLDTIVLVIASDVAGALSGAANGVIGVVIGASCASIIMAFQIKSGVA